MQTIAAKTIGHQQDKCRKWLSDTAYELIITAEKQSQDTQHTLQTQFKWSTYADKEGGNIGAVFWAIWTITGIGTCLIVPVNKCDETPWSSTEENLSTVGATLQSNPACTFSFRSGNQDTCLQSGRMVSQCHFINEKDPVVNAVTTGPSHCSLRQERHSPMSCWNA